MTTRRDQTASHLGDRTIMSGKTEGGCNELRELRIVGNTEFFSETGTEGGYWAIHDRRGMHDASQLIDGRCPWGPEHETRFTDGTSFCPAMREPTRDDPNPKHATYYGLFTLQTGDRVIIYDEVDPTKIVFEGKISLEPLPLFTEHAHGLWIHNDQKGQDREAWAELFLKELPAVLIRPNPSEHDLEQERRLQDQNFNRSLPQRKVKKWQ